jgi:uncharacterized Ntn-hydrolase superfamily protein
MTFSICAFDETTGSLCFAVASKWTAVGAFVPYFSPRIGLVLTQGYSNAFLAKKILSALRTHTPNDAINSVLTDLAHTYSPNHRQVLAMTSDGRAGGFTGGKCAEYCSHIIDFPVAVGGNNLFSPDVLHQMIDGFHAAKGDIEWKLLNALKLGDRVGGDRRGREAAAIKVFSNNCPHFDNWPTDIRVDSSPNPISDLSHILENWKSIERKMPSMIKDPDSPAVDFLH